MPSTSPDENPIDDLTAGPLTLADTCAIRRVRDFLSVHLYTHGAEEPIAVIDQRGAPGGHLWELTPADLGRALVAALPHTLIDGMKALGAYDEPAPGAPAGANTDPVPREQRMYTTPIEVIYADETAGTARVVVVGWDVGLPVAVFLAPFKTATGLDAAGLVAARWLEAQVNIYAQSPEDLKFQNITVAPALPDGFMGVTADA